MHRIQTHSPQTLGILLAFATAVATALGLQAQDNADTKVLLNDRIHGSGADQAASDNRRVSPEDYVYWHSLALTPDADGNAGKSLFQIMLPDVETVDWQEAMEQLARNGDAYTLHLLQRVRSDDPRKSRTIQTTREQIEARVAKPSTVELSTVIRTQLERAALADVTCARIESDLCPWVRKSIGARREDPEVKAILQEIAKDPAEPETANDAKAHMRKRVRNYAQGLLQPAPTPPATSAQPF